jgi:Na+/H+ antiporter NhaD/arsenite permease-like protein
MVTILFILGYLAIIFEHPLKLNKTASALVTGVLCWTAWILTGDPEFVNSFLGEQLGGLAGILFFLLGAMTTVELIDAHDGFEVITERITTTNKRKLIIIVSVISFVLSAVLDNLTTAIVMITLIRKLTEDKNDRMFFGGAVVIAANAGGVFSPIGDVTTTMLWVGNQITAGNIITSLFLPSLVCLLVPVLWMWVKLKGTVQRPSLENGGGRNKVKTSEAERNTVFIFGTGVLIFVPIFKSLTHLPPFMGILLGVGLLWIVTEIIHKQKNDEHKTELSVAGALQRVDTPSILFFLGILLAIGALEGTGVLHHLAEEMNNMIGNIDLIAIVIGLASAVIDNVPLVAAAQGMYSLAEYPTDHHLWEILAYCAGTGGSILIIGSAAGVAIMGIEKISFLWYLRKISFPALLGFLSGALVYIGQEMLLNG